MNTGYIDPFAEEGSPGVQAGLQSINLKLGHVIETEGLIQAVDAIKTRYLTFRLRWLVNNCAIFVTPSIETDGMAVIDGGPDLIDTQAFGNSLRFQHKQGMGDVRFFNQTLSPLYLLSVDYDNGRFLFSTWSPGLAKLLDPIVARINCKI